MTQFLFRKDTIIVLALSMALVGVWGCSKKDEGNANPSPNASNPSSPNANPAGPTADNSTNPSAAPDASKPLPKEVKTPEEMREETAKRMPKLTPEQQQQAIEKVAKSARGTKASLDTIGMPKYPGTQPVGAEKSDTGRVIYFFNMMTKDKYDKVLAFYRPTLKDVKEKSDGTPFSIAGTSAKGVTLTVTAKPWQDGSLTLIVITATKPS